MFEPGKPIVTLTDAAATQVRALMDAAANAIIGLRIGIKTAGCSGLQYDVQYATETKPFEDKVEEKGVTLLIDPTAVMFLIGSEMDWEETKFASRFVFNNPNEAARCGCGESFTVASQG
ncbi:MAG: iron-sulfur cluster assembly accessory protein [SAR116 cluster bacterium]|nr:iron-sulfur cluster assembly accessory protein [SAR116 cluster bacterium]